MEVSHDVTLLVVPPSFGPGAIAGQKCFQTTEKARNDRVSFLGLENGGLNHRGRSARREGLNAAADSIASFAGE